MSELRWILLAAGVALIVGLYVWGVRARRRSATPDLDGARRIEATAAPVVSKPVPEPIPIRREPRLSLDDEVDADSMSSPEAVESARDVEPVIDLAHEERAISPTRASPGARTEPTISSVPEPTAPAASMDGSERRPTPRSAQKIVAVRVAAPMPTRFEGLRLREALDRNGLRHGRFDIFHRLAPDGRPIISLASVVEPGTFDPAGMDKAAYPGVALFTVLPGPVSALDALEDLLVTSRALATQLGGTVLDEKGAPLSLQRIAHMRDDVLAFERNARTTEATG
jgi:cell division protein ZipA